MRLKSSFVCSICNLVLKNPVKLPCLDLICRKHVRDSAKNASIRCTKCEKDFTVPQQGFESNTVMATKLSKLLHLSIEEKRIKHTIEGVISQIEQLTENLNRMHSDLEQNSFAHFAEIRRKIEIQRKSLNAKIDEIALKMIEQTNQKEKVYNAKLNKFFVEIAKHDIKKKSQALLNEFRNPSLVSDEVRRLQASHEIKITDLQFKVAQLNALNREIKSLGFGANPVFHADSFGFLKLNNQKLVSCSEDKTIKIWDLDTNECVNTLDEQKDQVWCLEAIGCRLGYCK